MTDFQKERIVHKMSWEIGNMMNLSTEDQEKMESLLNKMSKRRSQEAIIKDVEKIYNWVGSLGVKPKTRRGIFYKVDVIIRGNEKISKNVPEVSWKKMKS